MKEKEKGSTAKIKRCSRDAGSYLLIERVMGLEVLRTPHPVAKAIVIGQCSVARSEYC